MKIPKKVRVKKYNNGYAVELFYGLIWRNLHSVLYDFPDEYYFKTEEQANYVMSETLKLIKQYDKRNYNT